MNSTDVLIKKIFKAIENTDDEKLYNNLCIIVAKLIKKEAYYEQKRSIY